MFHLLLQVVQTVLCRHVKRMTRHTAQLNFLDLSHLHPWMQKLLKGMLLLQNFINIVIYFIVLNPATFSVPLIIHPLYQYLPPSCSHYPCVSFRLVILALTFMGPCVVVYSCSTTNKMHLFSNYVFL